MNLKRLNGVLQLAHEAATGKFEELLLIKGLGPRTLQSLTLVSEVIHGTPSRFTDPARFSFAHGSKGGNPFPVPTQVYEETIQTLTTSVELAKMGTTDKQKAFKKLSGLAKQTEKLLTAPQDLPTLLEKEKRNAWKHGGRTMKGYVPPPDEGQLNLFE